MIDDGLHDAIVRGCCDSERFPALAYNAQPMRELCHFMAHELDEVAGPVTVGDGRRLDGEALLASFLAMGLIVRKMTPDEMDGYDIVHREVFGA